MTFEQEEHMDWLVSEFKTRFIPKYKKGSEQHKENMLLKDDLLEEAIAENLDQFAYLMTLWRKKQLEK